MSMLDELTTSPNPNLAALVELYQDGNNGGPGATPTTLPAARLSEWGRKGKSHFKSNTFTRNQLATGRADHQPESAGMERVDVEVAVERRRLWLANHLDAAARRLHVTRSDERVVNTYDMRSAGTVVHDSDSTAWLRIVVEDTDYQPASRWEGNVEANAIQGVPKPTVLRWIDWHATNEYGEDRRLRAEIMTLALGQSITPDDGLLTHDPELSDQWWADLNAALRTLAAHTPAPGDVVDILGYTAHLTRELLGREFDPTPIDITWSTAHADLHWANLTGPELCILDWESWRTAPAGYDAATLYCNSLLHPPTAERVRRTFADVLDTPTGRVSQLAAALRYLILAEDDSAYEELAAPLRALCADVLDLPPTS